MVVRSEREAESQRETDHRNAEARRRGEATVTFEPTFTRGVIDEPSVTAEYQQNILRTAVAAGCLALGVATLAFAQGTIRSRSDE